MCHRLLNITWKSVLHQALSILLYVRPIVRVDDRDSNTVWST